MKIPEHWNHESMLPPVDCPLLLSVHGVPTKATRVSHVRNRNAEMEYLLDGGTRILGRFKWTYP